MINEQELIEEIQNTMMDFYGLDVSEEVIKDFIQLYHYDRIEDDPDYDGNFCFDTGEREDLVYYLEELGLVKLN